MQRSSHGAYGMHGEFSYFSDKLYIYLEFYSNCSIFLLSSLFIQKKRDSNTWFAVYSKKYWLIYPKNDILSELHAASLRNAFREVAPVKTRHRHRFLTSSRINKHYNGVKDTFFCWKNYGKYKQEEYRSFCCGLRQAALLICLWVKKYMFSKKNIISNCCF